MKRLYPLRGVIDRQLFRDLLGPGERSAVFAIQSRSGQHYLGDLALHFFYLNVGRPGKPWLARVEIPAWVAKDNEQLDNLQAVLMQQCQILGSRPFPYLIHRAHEVAVVSLDEKEQVEQDDRQRAEGAGGGGGAGVEQAIRERGGGTHTL